jgi:hypothetical protein
MEDIMNAPMENFLSNYPDPSLALDGVIDNASFNYPDPSLVLEQVIGCLDDALRSFAQGDEGQACRSLAEANSVFDSCQKSETGLTPISMVDSVSPRPVEREATPLARAASA